MKAVQFPKALPEYNWHLDLDRGVYVEFIKLYGGTVQYLPYCTSTAEEVRIDLETLRKRCGNPAEYFLPLNLKAGMVPVSPLVTP